LIALDKIKVKVVLVKKEAVVNDSVARDLLLEAETEHQSEHEQQRRDERLCRTAAHVVLVFDATLCQFSQSIFAHQQVHNVQRVVSATNDEKKEKKQQ
jgi:hypothetical protein